MLTKVLVTLGVWVLCWWAWAMVLTETMLGPIVFVFDSNHGVHVGDLVASVVLPAYGLWLTWAFWRRPPDRNRRQP